jgi:DNA-binding winged helix-turn-helix (wHTH) protein
MHSPSSAVELCLHGDRREMVPRQTKVDVVATPEEGKVVALQVSGWAVAMGEPTVAEPVFRFGEFHADVRARELHRGNALIPLQDQPFRILAALLSRRGALVTRDELRGLLWSNDTFVDFDHGLNTAIRKLRDALGDSATTPRFIETLPKRGYRFIAPAEPLVSAGTAVVVASPGREDSPTAKNRARWILVAALVIGAALVLVGTMTTRVAPPTREAYDLYLRGKMGVRQENAADITAAIKLLERAVELAPGFAPAFAELSHAYGLRVAQFAPDDAVALARAEFAAEKALRLDPNLGESHYAAGQLLWGVVRNRFLAERATREFKLALKLNPNLDEAHHHLGQVYLNVGLLDQAVAELEKTLQLQPGDHNAIRRLGIALVYRGRYEEGLRTFRQVPSQANSALWHYQVAWVLLYLGKTDEAWSVLDGYLQRHPDDPGGVVTSTRAIWLAKAGDTARTEADIASATVKGKGFIHFHHTAYNIASAYALLHRPRQALEWLRTAAETV